MHHLQRTSRHYYYYYYHAAFNAPCVGRKDDESQVPGLDNRVRRLRSQVPGPGSRFPYSRPGPITSYVADLYFRGPAPAPFPRVATSCIRSLQFRDPTVARVSGAHYRVLSPWSRVHGSRVAGDGRSLTEASSSSSSRSRRLRDKSTRRRRPPDGFDTQPPAQQWRRHTRSLLAAAHFACRRPHFLRSSAKCACRIFLPHKLASFSTAI